MSDTFNASAAFATPAGDDEQALVQRIVAGDTSAFELLMRRNNLRLYRAIRSLVRDEDTAEELSDEKPLKYGSAALPVPCRWPARTGTTPPRARTWPSRACLAVLP